MPREPETAAGRPFLSKEDYATLSGFVRTDRPRPPWVNHAETLRGDLIREIEAAQAYGAADPDALADKVMEVMRWWKREIASAI